MAAILIKDGPLSASLRSDPIMNYLLNGGSWFEADQMYWRQVLGNTTAALARGPSAARRKALLQTKAEAEKQLCIPPAAAPAKGGQTLPTAPKAPAVAGPKNAFSALAEESEEDDE
jgi:hypothetical protein